MNRFWMGSVWGGLMLAALAGRAAERPIVAVFPIQDVSGKLERTLVDSLTETLSAAVATGGSFSIQAPGDMKRLLTEKTSESYRACFDERCQIELGRELAANKILNAKIIQLGDACTVTAALYDLRTQATDITATEDGGCSPKQLKGSLDRVAARIRAWGSRGRARPDSFREGQIGERPRELDFQAGEETIVAFGSRPAGAVVIVDGNLVCEQTPCSRKFAAGPHEVSMQMKRHLGRTEQAVFARGLELDWELEPTFGLLTVSSQPEGLQVLLNGEAVGVTPLSRHPVDPGNYEVLVASPCHYDQGERVAVLARQERSVDVHLRPKVGGLQVDAKDPAGNDVEAELEVDGQPLGSSPGRFQVSVCARKLTARTSRGAAEVDLEVGEGEWRKLNLTLLPQVVDSQGTKTGPASGQAEEQKPVKIDFRMAPTFGYGGMMGLSGQSAEGAQITTDVSGLSAGARLDLFFGSLLGLVARYDYLFLENAGLGSLSAAITYSGLWGTLEKESFEMIPSASMYLGLAVVHAPATAFAELAREDLLEVGLLLSLDLSLDFVIGELFFVGAAGEFGYLFTSLGESQSAGYMYAVTARTGVRF